MRRIAIEADDLLSFRDLLRLPLSIACTTVEEICEFSTCIVQNFDAEDKVVLLIEANADFSDCFLRIEGFHFESIARGCAFEERRLDLAAEVKLDLVKGCALE